MGAWDEGAFGNDTAADWSAHAGEIGTLEFLQETMNTVLTETDYLDTYYADKAIAAAAITAWLNGHPTAELAHTNAYAEKATSALAKFKNTPAAKTLVPVALKVITRMKDPNDNEAWELWLEGETDTQNHPWLKSLREIETCLNAAV